MADIAIIARPVTDGTRQALVLTEDRLGHYPEFRAFFVRTFDLDRVGLSEPGFLRTPSGMAYALVVVGRSGEPFPSGLEIHAIVEALEPLDDAVVDKDLWAILCGIIGGVGAVDGGGLGRDWSAVSHSGGGMTRSGWNGQDGIT